MPPDQHRSWIECKTEDDCKYIVPADRRQFGWNRFDAKLLDTFGLMVAPADSFFDFRDSVHCRFPRVNRRGSRGDEECEGNKHARRSTAVGQTVYCAICLR